MNSNVVKKKVAKKKVVAAVMPPKTVKPKFSLGDEYLKAVADIEKVHGIGHIQDGDKIMIANHIPTGNFILDFALLGGMADGYNCMVYGYESAGKTTQMMSVAGEYQKKHKDKIVIWVDAEGLYDPEWAMVHGIDLERLKVLNPESGEQGVDMIEAMWHVWDVGMICLDSVPALVPMEILDKSAEDATMAKLAGLMGKLCSKITMANNKERRRGHWVTFCYVNQMRSKVGFVLGNPNMLTGGRQINHIPTTKILLKKGKEIEGKDRYGNPIIEYNEHSFKLEKTKHGSSIKEGSFQLYLNPDNEEGLAYGELDNVSTCCNFAKKMGFIKGGGSSWYLLTENRDEKLKKMIVEAKELETEIPTIDDVPFTKFRVLDDIKKYVQENDEEYVTLARSVIALQRLSKNVPMVPPDGYLVADYGRLITLDADGAVASYTHV